MWLANEPAGLVTIPTATARRIRRPIRTHDSVEHTHARWQDLQQRHRYTVKEQ